MKKQLIKLVQSNSTLSEAYLRYLKMKNASDRKANVALLYTGRCGATLIGHLLAQHPDVNWGGELLNHASTRYKHFAWQEKQPIKIIEQKMYQKPLSVYGFESKALQGGHLRPNWVNMSTQTYINSLLKVGFSLFIVIKRENYINRAVSSLIAKKRKKWTANLDETVKLETVYLDLNRFRYGDDFIPLLDHFKQLDLHYEMLSTLLKGKPVLSLSYEAEIEPDPILAYTKVCDFIGIESAPVSLQCQKIDPYHLCDVISNFDEVVNALRNTQWAWMLNV